MRRLRTIAWTAPLWAAPLWAQYEGAGTLEVMGLDSTRTATAVYVGAEACRPCHETAYQSWLASPHARSWVFLATPAASQVARRHTPAMAVPQEMGLAMAIPRMAACLECHATAADVEPGFRDPAFRLEEGVQCEACHGPGSQHLRPGLVVAGAALRASRMRRPVEEDCRVCHKGQRPSHDWMERPPYDHERALARTVHPTTLAQRWEVLTGQPGAYLSISLRTLLGTLSGN